MFVKYFISMTIFVSFENKVCLWNLIKTTYPFDSRWLTILQGCMKFTVDAHSSTAKYLDS